MKFKEIVKLLNENKLVKEYDLDDLSFSNVCYNSKDISNDSIFICKGLNFKKEYLEEAIKKGIKAYVSEVSYDISLPKIIVTDVLKAMALISEKLYDDKTKNLTLIGITGTKGKTTTVEFIRNILDTSTNKRNAYWETIDHFSGKTYGKSHNTTPESVDIYKVIKDAKEENLPYYIMEVSSQAKKLDRIYGINFNIGAILNLSYDHISPLEHNDFNDYKNCKIGFLKQCDTVFVYDSMDYFDDVISSLKDKKVITFGEKESSSYYFFDVNKYNNKTYFKVKHNDIIKDYCISIDGYFNVINALLAIAICDNLNISYFDILKGLEMTKVSGRMNVYKTDKCLLVVDYAHNKLSVEALLKSLKKDYPNKNIKLVFGCPGDKAINRRKDVATLAGIYASYVYLTEEDPQSKTVKEICEEIANYLKFYDVSYEIIEDREQAIIKAYNDSSSSDIVAVIGKGDETYQLEKSYVYYKSDVKVASEIASLVKERN